jgi:hypothetical protein
MKITEPWLSCAPGALVEFCFEITESIQILTLGILWICWRGCGRDRRSLDPPGGTPSISVKIKRPDPILDVGIPMDLLNFCENLLNFDFGIPMDLLKLQNTWWISVKITRRVRIDASPWKGRRRWTCLIMS